MARLPTHRLMKRLERKIDAMTSKIEAILKKVRQSDTLQDGLIALVEGQRTLITDLRQQLVQAGVDTGKADEAIAILDAINEEGEEALTENTEFAPSAN